MTWPSSSVADALPLDRRDGGITMLGEGSASMSPLIQVGDRLAVAWGARSRAPRGAVVAYLDGRRVVVHRLIAWTPSGMLLKGDANREVDPPVDVARYCGEVVAVSRAGGPPVDLTSRRWRVVGRALATAATLPGGGTLGWIVTRAICHVAARWLR